MHLVRCCSLTAHAVTINQFICRLLLFIILMKYIQHTYNLIIIKANDKLQMFKLLSFLYKKSSYSQYVCILSQFVL